MAPRTALAARCALLLLAGVGAADVSAKLRAVVFGHAGTVRAETNLTRLEQCSSFTECFSVWTCGSPRDYLWDTSRGAQPGAGLAAPPMGLRSAVPLGGIGAGTFELRGDGSFADWTLENQGTALAANAVLNSKLPLKAEALLGLYIAPTPASNGGGGGGGGAAPFAAALRTSPPPGVPGVEALTYSGAHPFARLALNDSRAGALLDEATVFAYSYYAPGSGPFNAAAPSSPPAATDSATQSGLPFVAFSLVVRAPAAAAGPTTVSFLLSLPLSTSQDTARPFVGGNDARGQTLAVLPGLGAPACLAACAATPGCVWWAHAPPTPPVPDRTEVNSDCAGDDIYSPPRIAVPTLQDCIAQCTANVPGCNGLVFDEIASEQQGQCGNSNASLYCCLPKTSCSDFGPKQGDTAWARGSPGNANETCSLFRLAPNVEQFAHGSGVRSGVNGAWATTSAPAASLTLRRNAYDADPAAAFQDPASAGASYSLVAADADVQVSFATADSLEQADGVWPAFAATGRLSGSTPRAAGHGAIAATAVLAPGEERSVTIVFAWHVPQRLYVGQEVGNAYAGPFADALAVARAAAAIVPDVVDAGAAWVKVFTSSSLAANWMDFFVNSVSSQAKMSVWVARDRFGAPLPGGRFRTFEAFSNCDLAPVHVLDYSMIPLALAFPSLLQNEVETGWAQMQQDDGMIREFLGDFSAPGGRLTGQMDLSAGGRTMGDVTSVFILATLACVRSSGDTGFLGRTWPSVVRAAQWQIARAEQYGCPSFVQTTYDYLGLDRFPLAMYNAVLHLAAMRATVRLAAIVGDNSLLARNASASEAACLATIGASLWSDKLGAWRAWQTADGSAPDLVLSGALHGQSWATFTGLGLLLPVANATRHLAAELALNCAYSPGACELGLLTLPGAGGTWTQDASPAMSMDATAARVIFGAGGLAGSVAEASIALYRETHRDLWHFTDLHMGPAGYTCGGADLSGPFLAGQPFVNSHYSRQLQGWAALVATTGEDLDAVAGTLRFSPTCEGRARDAASGGFELRLPFFSPTALGLLRVRWNAAGAPAGAELELLRGALPARLAEGALVDLSRCPEGGGRAKAPLLIAVVGTGEAN